LNLKSKALINDVLRGDIGNAYRLWTITNANTSPETRGYMPAKARKHMTASNAAQLKILNVMKQEAKFVVHLVDWF
jgi:hypothetical protein